MALAGSEYELVGVSVAGHGPVRSITHLELNGSVEALYGLNGAGKSRLLKLAASALTGVVLDQGISEHSVADLHIRLNDPEARVWGDFPTQLSHLVQERVALKKGALAQSAFAEAAYDPDPEVLELVERRSTDDVWTHLAALVDLSAKADEISSRLASEIYEGFSAGLLTLRAVGTMDQPAWNAYVSVPASSDFLTGQLRRSANALGELRQIAGMDDPEEQRTRYEALLSTLRGNEVLVPASPYWELWSAESTALQPAWLQVPVFEVASHITAPQARVLGLHEHAGEGLDESTLSQLIAMARGGTEAVRRHVVTDISDGTAEFSPFLKVSMERVVRDANKYVGTVLLDPPDLRFSLGSPDDWLTGTRPSWQFREEAVDEWLPIGELSSARSRWARLAIELAVAPVDEVPTIFICDEPEAGLHRLAEQQLARGLPVLASSRPFCVLAATHSPALLNAPLVDRLLISRDSPKGARVRPVALSVVNRLASELSAHEYGLSVGDLWALMKVAVVVEGLHDEWVFAALIRDDLDAASAGIYPMHGATRLRSLADAGALMDGTDAKILVVLDDLLASHVLPLWGQIQTAARQGDFDGARAAIEDLKGMGESFLFIHQFAVRALEIGRVDRVDFHGLSLPDVICYLPPDDVLLETEHQWEGLIAQWRQDFDPSPATNIKGWLKKKRLLPTVQSEIDQRIAEAADRMRKTGAPIHGDIVELGLRLREIALGAHH